MYYDILIVGQGISGTFLSFYLQQSGLSILVIDDARPNAASRAASGVINPITGRRIVKTWMIEELMVFAKKAYREIGEELSIECFKETKIIDFFSTPQMRHAFLARYEEDQTYIQLPSNENDQRENFNYDFGYGEIYPGYLINLQLLLSSFKAKLLAEGRFREEHFTTDKLRVSDKNIQYNDIFAEKIIFCDGIESFANPFFKTLPFALNKGEALIIETEDFSTDFLYKRGISIVPLQNRLFWVGSSYEWEFSTDQPNIFFRERTELILLDWLKVPFKIIDHVAAVRPATLERRPFVGFHPKYKNVGILNGMGTKGCSLAPYFASQLIQNVLHQTPILREADINRFEKILNRS
ncbi:MAG TPA: FAD-binding oxidoreductase [Puia sp.]|nr:FAD-binding oxidoreductase [Puia sp.]